MVLAQILTLTVPAGAITAQTPADRSASWQRYDVDLDVRADGSLGVTETQTVMFRGTYQRASRTVPTDRTTGITDVSVGEMVNGQLTPYVAGSARPGTFTSILSSTNVAVNWWFPPTTNTTRTFVLRYTVRGALRIYGAGDQLQWKAIYADRAGPVEIGTVTVRLPAPVAADQLTSAYYRYQSASAFGADRAAGTGERVDDRTTRFRVGSLDAATGAEVRVQFPTGMVAATPPPWQARADAEDRLRQTIGPISAFVSLLLAAVILVGGGIFLGLRWYATGRDPAIKSVPRTLSEPPSDLPAPLAGTLVDEVADVQDAVATLADLAQRGVVVMTELQDPALVGSTRDVELRLASSPAAPELRAYERTLLAGLFGSDARAGATVRLSAVRGRFATVIPVLQAQIYAAVVTERLFVRDPEATRRANRGRGWALVFAGIMLAAAAIALAPAGVTLAWLPGVAVAVIGFALTRLASAMPRRTAAGALEAARWRAFQRGLADGATGDRGQKYLPYAVALGVDRAWLRQLEAVGTPAPSWYGGPAGVPGPGGGMVILPGWYGGLPSGDGSRRDPGATPGDIGGGFSVPDVPGPSGWSDGLADLLNSASDALASGGGSGGWSGGGFGGGGGGGGGSGDFS